MITSKNILSINIPLNEHITQKGSPFGEPLLQLKVYFVLLTELCIIVAGGGCPHFQHVDGIVKVG